LLGKRKERQGSLFSPVRRETRVSRELSRLKELVDFEWLREAAKDKFAADGRPSISPEVLGAMMMLGFWFDVSSDRELCDECEDRLSFREFIGLSDEDEVPVHSSLTHWRQRLGRDVFREFIRHSLEVAVSKGMTPGRLRLFDSTLSKAQADAGGPSRIDIHPLEQTNDYLESLGSWEEAEELPVVEEDEDRSKRSEDTARAKGSSCSTKLKHGGRRKRNRRKLKTGAPIVVSAHDMDARFLSRRGKRVDFYHKLHFECDSKTSLVMNADAGHVGDATKMMEFLDTEIYPMDTVGGDTGYFTGQTQRMLKSRGLVSLISVRDNSNNGGRAFGLDAFVYLADSDEYVCPAGAHLRRQGTSSKGETRYATARGICAACELREYCFQPGRLGTRRQLTLSADRETVEEARRINRSHRYQRVKVKRSIVCEGDISAMKRYHGLERAKGLGEESMAIQAMMSAGVCNFKKILKFLDKQTKNAGAAVSGACVTILRRLFGFVASSFGQTELQGRSMARAA